MHWQRSPAAEGKLVRCISGSIYDVIVDIRPGSATYCEWFGIELAADRPVALYVPPGLAHGFLTLADDTDLYYQMTEFFEPALAEGARWNYPAFGIEWPGEVVAMSERDRGFADFKKVG